MGDIDIENLEKNKMRVLFTTPILEHPPAGGPQLRIENSIKALAKVCDLYIACRVSVSSLGGTDAETFYAGYCKEFWYTPSVVRQDIKPEVSTTTSKMARKLKSLCNRLKGASAKSVVQENDASAIVDYARRNGIGIIWFGYGNISYQVIKHVKNIAPEMRLICDTDSVWSRFVLRELPFEKDVMRKAEISRIGKEKEQEERAWVALCDVTTAVSPVDAEYYSSLTNEKDKIRLFSNVIDLASYNCNMDAPAGWKRPCIYLAGTFGHRASPMDRAARWILENVLPLVHEKMPDVHFYVLGSGSDRSLADIAGPHVSVLGKVPSVLPYLGHADVALVPLMFESGTRFKIMEAGACGIPIVSTTLGAEGIPLTNGSEILIADGADAFAAAILSILESQDLAQTLADNCRAFIRRNYSLETLENEARLILQYLCDK